MSLFTGPGKKEMTERSSEIDAPMGIAGTCGLLASSTSVATQSSPGGRLAMYRSSWSAT